MSCVIRRWLKLTISQSTCTEPSVPVFTAVPPLVEVQVKATTPRVDESVVLEWMGEESEQIAVETLASCLPAENATRITCSITYHQDAVLMSWQVSGFDSDQAAEHAAGELTGGLVRAVERTHQGRHPDMRCWLESLRLTPRAAPTKPPGAGLRTSLATLLALGPEFCGHQPASNATQHRFDPNRVSLTASAEWRSSGGGWSPVGQEHKVYSEEEMRTSRPQLPVNPSVCSRDVAATDTLSPQVLSHAPVVTAAKGDSDWCSEVVVPPRALRATAGMEAPRGGRGLAGGGSPEAVTGSDALFGTGGLVEDGVEEIAVEDVAELNLSSEDESMPRGSPSAHRTAADPLHPRGGPEVEKGDSKANAPVSSPCTTAAPRRPYPDRPEHEDHAASPAPTSSPSGSRRADGEDGLLGGPSGSVVSIEPRQQVSQPTISLEEPCYRMQLATGSETWEPSVGGGDFRGALQPANPELPGNDQGSGEDQQHRTDKADPQSALPNANADVGLLVLGNPVDPECLGKGACAETVEVEDVGGAEAASKTASLSGGWSMEPAIQPVTPLSAGYSHAPARAPDPESRPATSGQLEYSQSSETGAGALPQRSAEGVVGGQARGGMSHADTALAAVAVIHELYDRVRADTDSRDAVAETQDKLQRLRQQAQETEARLKEREAAALQTVEEAEARAKRANEVAEERLREAEARVAQTCQDLQLRVEEEERKFRRSVDRQRAAALAMRADKRRYGRRHSLSHSNRHRYTTETEAMGMDQPCFEWEMAHNASARSTTTFGHHDLGGAAHRIPASSQRLGANQQGPGHSGEELEEGQVDLTRPVWRMPSAALGDSSAPLQLHTGPFSTVPHFALEEGEVPAAAMFRQTHNAVPPAASCADSKAPNSLSDVVPPTEVGLEEGELPANSLFMPKAV